MSFLLLLLQELNRQLLMTMFAEGLYFLNCLCSKFLKIFPILDAGDETSKIVVYKMTIKCQYIDDKYKYPNCHSWFTIMKCVGA